MIKFGRRFFFERTYKKRNFKKPLIIIGCSIGALVVLAAIIYGIYALIHFIIVQKSKPSLELKSSITIQLNSEMPSEKQFIKEIKNLKTKDITMILPDDLELITDLNNCKGSEIDIDNNTCVKTLVSKTGEYKITFTSDKLKGKYTSKLKVVDTKKPTLKLKEVTLVEGTAYKINDFIESCVDNSGICNYDFAKVYNKDNNLIDYTKFTEAGEYEIKIYAYDGSYNKTKNLSTKLILTKKEEKPAEDPNKPGTNQNTGDNNSKKSNNGKTNNGKTNKNSQKNKCTYGDMQYSNSYVLAVKIAGSCAISPEEADSLSRKEAQTFNKLLAKEMSNNYIQTKLGTMNLDGDIKININYGEVLNKAGKGAVGYFISTEASQTINGKTTIIEKYFLDTNGNKVWKIDSLNIK